MTQHQLSSLHAVDISTSTPSESTDWVSPFTLPPLPAFARRKTGLISPQGHQRSNSSAYYAAAWGSPYATPSPAHSPPPNSVKRALSFQDFSPIDLRVVPANTTEPNQRSPGIAKFSARERRKRAEFIQFADSSEAPNWLSDSDDSDILANKRTPTRDLSNTFRRTSHKLQESVATVTQESYKRQPAPSAIMEDAFDQKPLPSIPRGSVSSRPGTSGGSPTRPKLGTLESFQRPRKKVLWKGKSCIIALPLDDAQRFQEKPLLSPTDVRNRLHKWEEEGYDTRGFVLDNSSNTSSSQRDSQSRPLHPDPADMHRERQGRTFNVSIPNQAEWESWVEFLKEEKLRALGVTSSNSEAPGSTRSPLSGTLSRTSSQYPSVPISPDNGPFGFTGATSRVSSNPFALPFIKSPGTASSSVPGASPVYESVGGLRHGYKQSMVMQPRTTSPFDYPVSQPSVHSARSPPGYFNQRQMSISPAGRGGVLSLGEVLSPVSPFLQDQSAMAPRSDPMVEQTNIQQSQVSHQPLHVLPQPFRQSSPITPQPGPDSRPSLEIAHPTPRSHRHNLSEALQREIDDAERTIEENDRKAEIEQGIPVEQPSHADEAGEALLHEEDDGEEPPITQHPDAMDNRSEIETNPSLAASPIPTAERNPFENWQNRPPLPETRPSTFGTKGHTAKPSVSKLNVEAKPFDPKGVFSTSSFAFGEASFNPFGPGQGADMPLFRSSMPLPAGKPVVPSPAPRLNVAAPAFTPMAAKPTLPRIPSSFKFSSATFNVEAPEFNPTQSLGNSTNPPVIKESGDSTSRIFGDVVIDPTLHAATRRNSKAVPMVRPISKDGPENDYDSNDSAGMLASEEDDDEGRPQAPIERQKRVRRVDSDGDRSPVFAASAPFLQGIKSQLDDDPFLDQSIQISTLLDYPAVTAKPSTEKPESDAYSADMEESSSYTFMDETDAIKLSGATPLVFPIQSPNAEEMGNPEDELPVSGHTDSELESPPSRLSDHKPRSSLSALAKPFEFRAKVSSLLPSHQPAQTIMAAEQPAKLRKSVGLEASRFAATPSPSSSPLPPPEVLLGQHDKAIVAKDIDDSFISYISDANNLHLQRDREEGAFDNGQDSEPIGDSGLSDREDVLESVDEPVPSYEEIDAVMRQFEDNPDLGVERLDTPPVRSTPLTELHLPPNLRSDAPSPSPKRTEPQKIEAHGGEWGWRPPKQTLDTDISVHKLTSSNEPVSDWNDAMSPVQIDELESRSQFFDGHVNDLVDGILENRLGPLERTLGAIQNSIALLATQPKASSGRRSTSTDLKSKDSDADDEDDYDAFEGWEAYRSRSPSAKKNRKPDRIRAAVMDALAAHHAPLQEQTRKELDAVHVAIAELKDITEQSRSTPSNDSEALKSVVEEVIGTHPRLRGHRVQQSHGGDDKRMLQVNGLETMLKVAEERAETEARSRRQAEDELADALRQLRYAEEEVAQHKESSQEAERSLSAFIKEKQAYQDLEDDVQNLKWKNAALETTLEEYRVSSDKWRDDIQDERAANKTLRRALEEVKDQLDERSQSRQALRNKVEQLQQAMHDVARDFASDQAEWRKQEHALISKHSITQTALEHELRHHEKMEREFDELEKEHKENVRYRSACGIAEQETTRLLALTSTLQAESKSHQDRAFELERELSHAKENAQTVLTNSALAVQAELKQTKADAANMRADFEAQIARHKSRVDNAELDLEEQKAKHGTTLAETVDAHNQALQETADEREATLQEQHDSHERKLADMRDRHTRALHNSSDDRHRLEHHLNEKLSLSDDKVQHLEGKVSDLEERLEITKSAARAAVEAATAKGFNLPTPAPSTVASPPQPPAVRGASIAFVPGSDIPEKISPQALRESIIVLQDQLQNREQTIEKLQTELAAIDKDAPAKIKDRETEIGWLRELLSVRIDDIEDIVNTLNKPDFDREAAKDAAIRLKANLQMEQQLKERAATGTAIQLPSVAQLSALTQSPRALPMAAMAALGNWRKARDSSFGALSDLASNLGQTPTRSTIGSPASFISGMITPPSTTVKTPTPSNPIMSPPSMRPLSSVSRKSSAEARPLRAYTSQPRTLSSRQQDKRPAAPQPVSFIPSTPPLMTQSEYDGDADVKSLTGDLDSDASPLDGKENKALAISADAE